MNITDTCMQECVKTKAHVELFFTLCASQNIICFYTLCSPLKWRSADYFVSVVLITRTWKEILSPSPTTPSPWALVLIRSSFHRSPSEEQIGFETLTFSVFPVFTSNGTVHWSHRLWKINFQKGNSNICKLDIGSKSIRSPRFVVSEI